MTALTTTMETPTERQLLARIAELERDVHHRTERLEAAVNELTTFAHAISHDLRAPLRGISGFSRALLEDHGPKLDDDGRRMVHLIRDESRRMTALIEGMLLFSR